MSSRPGTGVPIALPVVRVEVSADEAFTVSVDKEPYAVPLGFGRDQVRGRLADIADELGPIRVEITESNGAKYVDIQTPSDRGPVPAEPAPVQPASYGIRGRFGAGEDVLVTVVVARRTAEPDGTVAVLLPPAFVHRYGENLVLIGQATKTSTTITDGGVLP